MHGIKQRIKPDARRIGEWGNRSEKSIKNTELRDKGMENMKEMIRELEESGIRLVEVSERNKKIEGEAIFEGIMSEMLPYMGKM